MPLPIFINPSAASQARLGPSTTRMKSGLGAAQTRYPRAALPVFTNPLRFGKAREDGDCGQRVASSAADSTFFHQPFLTGQSFHFRAALVLTSVQGERLWQHRQSVPRRRMQQVRVIVGSTRFNGALTYGKLSTKL